MRFLAMRLGRRKRDVPAVGRGEPLALARDQLDDLAHPFVELAHQDVDSVEEIIIECDRYDGDCQAEGGGDQSQADAVRKRLAARGADAPAQGVE